MNNLKIVFVKLPSLCYECLGSYLFILRAKLPLDGVFNRVYNSSIETMPNDHRHGSKRAPVLKEMHQVDPVQIYLYYRQAPVSDTHVFESIAFAVFCNYHILKMESESD